MTGKYFFMKNTANYAVILFAGINETLLLQNNFCLKCS